MRNQEAKRSRELSIMTKYERGIAKAINPHYRKLRKQLAEMDKRAERERGGEENAA